MTGFPVVFFFVLASLLHVTAAGVEEPKTDSPPIRSAAEIDYPPFSLVDADGRANGFSVELLRAALGAMGQGADFRTGPWEDVKNLLENGEIRVLPIVGRTPEREAVFDFTFPYMTLHGAIVVQKGNRDIRSLNDLKGRKVAVMKGDNAEEFLRRENRGIDIRATPTYGDALGELSRGFHDAVVIQRLVGLRLIRETGFSNLEIIDKPVEGFHQDFCFAVREGDRDMLDLLNEGLSLIIADGTYRRLHAKWFAALELPTNRRIIFGGDNNYPPYEFLDENGRPAGYNVELTRAIAKETGLDVEIRLGPWAEIRRDLENGKIDAVQGMFYSHQRDLTFDFTPPHLVNHCVSVIRQKDGEPPAHLSELAGKRIVVQKGDIMHDFALENGLKDQLTPVESQEDALQQLSEGRHDCALVSRLTALYWIKELGLKNLKVGRSPFLSPDYCFAVPNSNKALLAQLSEGLKVLDESGEYRRIYEKWMGVYDDVPPDIVKFLRYAAFIISLLLLILLAFYLWSRSLRKQVASRTAALLKSEKQYRLLADNTLDVIWTMEFNYQITYVNPACFSLTGYSSEEFIGKRMPELCDEENLQKMKRIFFAEMEKGAAGAGVIFEAVLLSKSGRSVPVEIHARIIFDEQHQPLNIQGVARDIAERREAEQRLRRSESLLNDTQRISKIGGWEWNVERREMFWTEETYRIHDLEPVKTGSEGNEYLKKVVACYPEEDRPRLLSAFVKCMRQGIPYEVESRIVTLTGRHLWIRTAAQPVYENNRIVRVVGNIQDITEQKKAREAILYQDTLLREMGSIAKIGGWEFDPSTGDGKWTEEVARIHDLDPAAETSISTGVSFYQGDSRERIEKAVTEAIQSGKPYDVELELVTGKGARKWVRSMGQPKFENGKVVQIRGSFQDITERIHYRQHIEHLNRVLRAIRDVNQLIIHERDLEKLIQEGCRLLVDSRGYTSAMIILTDGGGRIESWAQAGSERNVKERMPGAGGNLPSCCESAGALESVLVIDDPKTACGFCPLIDGCDQKKAFCIRLIHDGVTFGYMMVSMERGFDTGSDEERSLFSEMAGDIAYALNVLRLDKSHEASEQKRKSLETQLTQAQRLESVGRLAGGVAHDFNNMLGVIIGYAELASEKVKPEETLHEDLKEILMAAGRSTDITRQLLAFARKQTVSPRVMDLNETVESMLKMLRRLIGEDIDLAWLPAFYLWPVKIDPSQVDQILANLTINARDAIAGVGSITIETKNAIVDETYGPEDSGRVPGEYVLLAVSDNGSGIPKENMDKIFEPFFTTKGLGKGTGLGLSTVYGIVRQNNGFINVYSEPGQGTTLKLYLPRHLGIKTGKTDQKAIVSMPGGHETVLLVEDEISILKLEKRMLESLGYSVMEAATPGKAAALAEAYAGKIHLLITDVVMPEMNGRDLSRNLKARYPDLKTIFLSGYTSNVIAHRGILEEGLFFLQKPFSKKELAVLVRKVLDNR